MKLYKLKKTLAFSAMALCFSGAVSAQVGPPDGDSDVDDSPIGGFVALGVAAAAIAGSKLCFSKEDN